MDSQQIIVALETERSRIDNAIAALRGKVRTSNRGRNVATPGKRKLSAASKRLISEKMKKRWAERKAGKLKVFSRKAA